MLLVGFLHSDVFKFKTKELITLTNNKLIISMLADIQSMLESDTTGSQYIKSAQEYIDLAKTTLQAYERKEHKCLDI